MNVSLNQLERGPDLPTTRSANFRPCSELAETPSGTVAAAIFVILIDEVFDAIMQPGFTASERDLNNDCLSFTFSEAAYRGRQGDSIHTTGRKGLPR